MGTVACRFQLEGGVLDAEREAGGDTLLQLVEEFC